MALRSAEEPAVAHKMSDKVWVLKAGSPVNPTPTNDTGRTSEGTLLSDLA